MAVYFQDGEKKEMEVIGPKFTLKSGGKMGDGSPMTIRTAGLEFVPGEVYGEGGFEAAGIAPGVLSNLKTAKFNPPGTKRHELCFQSLENDGAKIVEAATTAKPKSTKKGE